MGPRRYNVDRFATNPPPKPNVIGTQLLTQSRSSDFCSSSASLSQQVQDKAENAITLYSKDGFKTLALNPIDVALSPIFHKSLTKNDCGNELIKRAKIKLSMNWKARVDSVIKDLKSSCGAELGEWRFVRWESIKMAEETRKTLECGLNRGVGENVKEIL
ncbi:hypothetical protein TB1_031476 [Malus domestica]